jgi:pimeloyl-ACP methyl ester carboxylesterase
MAAIMAAAGRYSQLASVRVPTLVMHGDRDTVIPLAHGQNTANAIEGARLVVVEGLGHGLAFPNLWSRMVAAIAAHTAEAESHPDAVVMGQSQGRT